MNDEVRLDKGPISEKNARLLNHAHLGPLFPDWIPQLVLPEGREWLKYENRFPIQKIDGPTWNDAMYDRDFPLRKQIEIAVQTVHQLLELLTEYGVLLTDRHGDNVRIDRNGNVWQVDLDLLYDAVTGRSNAIGPKENLPSRLGEVKIKDRRQLEKAQAEVCHSILTDLNHAFWLADRREPLSVPEQAAYEAIKKLQESGGSVTLAQLADFLASLRV